MLIIIIVFSLFIDSGLITDQYHRQQLNYGPYIQPVGNQTQLLWYTFKKQPTQYFINDQLYTDDKPSKYHYAYTDLQEFTFSSATAKSVKFQKPQQYKNLLVVTDTHNTQFSRNLIGQQHKFDIILHAGDLTNLGAPAEFKNMNDAGYMHLLLAVGNHDDRYKQYEQQIGRNPNVYQRIGNIGVFIFYYTKANHKIDDVKKVFYENIYDQQVEHQLILSHYPLYSLGFFGSDKIYSKLIDELMDTPDNKIRALISGHDHCYSSFNKSNKLVFVAGVGGGSLAKYNFMRDRSWGSDELHGPQKPSKNLFTCMGYDVHLHSYMRSTIVHLSIEDNVLRYKTVDAISNEILVEYEQVVNGTQIQLKTVQFQNLNKNKN